MQSDGLQFLLLLIILVGAGLIESDAALQRHGSSLVRVRRMLPKSFASVSLNSYKEKELRIGFDRVVAIETFQKNEQFPEFSITMRQATDGKRLVQSVLQNGVLKECGFTKDLDQIREFVENFVESSDFDLDEFGDVIDSYHDEGSASLLANTILANTYFNSTKAPEELTDFLNIRLQRQRCRNFSKLAKAVARKEAKLLKHGEYINSSDEETNTFNDVVLARQKELQGLDGNLIKSDNSIKHINKRSADPVQRARSKRSSFDFNSVLIFPGTKWCGKGDLATCFDDLGDDKELDVCCRDHDCCQYIIPPFTSRFGTFNYRFHSLLHCECDQRFRGCLRESPSSTANMIGKIYFNILGSKCFEFQENEVCVSRAWYGYCRKYETQVTAVVKSQQSFYDECNSRNASSTTSSSSSSSSSSTTTTTKTTTVGNNGVN